MTVPVSIVTGAGLRAALVYELDTTTGQPKATSTTLYAGVLMQGAKVLTNTEPAPTRVPHIGEDRFLGFTLLPPKEGMTGEVRTGKKNLDIDALLRGQAVVTVGESKFSGIGTSQAGSEIQVALLAYQVAQDRDDASSTQGVGRYSSMLIPNARLNPKIGSFDDNAYESAYDVTPNAVSKYPWGVAFALATEKFLTAQALDGVHEGKPRLLCAIGDATPVTLYTFPTGIVAVSTSKIAVFKNGVLVSSGITKTINDITFTTGLGATDRVDILLEHL